MPRWTSVLLCFPLLSACGSPPVNGNPTTQEEFAQQREQMVETQLKSRDISNERVLEARRKVPRHLFMPEPARPCHAVESHEGALAQAAAVSLVLILLVLLPVAGAVLSTNATEPSPSSLPM